jgi:hypothetical protein
MTAEALNIVSDRHRLKCLQGNPFPFKGKAGLGMGYCSWKTPTHPHPNPAFEGEDRFYFQAAVQ